MKRFSVVMLIALAMGGCGGSKKETAAANAETTIVETTTEAETEPETTTEAEPETTAAETEPETAAETEPETIPVEPYAVVADISGREKDGAIIFTIATNLPDGTLLDVMLEDDDMYVERAEAKVESGFAVTEPFQIEGQEISGELRVGFDMYPSEQPESVKAIIGEHGEALKGDCVYDFDSFRMVELIKLYKEAEKITFAELVELTKNAFASVEHYTVTEEEFGIRIDTWDETMAMNAALAAAGVKDNAESWNSLAETIRKTSESIQRNILDANGYEDKSIAIQVLNDQNKDNVLFVAMSGIIVYDVVNGVDLLGLEN